MGESPSSVDVTGGDALCWSLTIVGHPDARHLGRRLAVADGVEEVLGRGSDAFGPGSLDDASISLAHVSLTATPGALLLHDEGSRNGTFVDGRRVQRARVVPLETVALGPVLLLATRTPPLYPRFDEPDLLCFSPEAGLVRERIGEVAPLSSPVLLHGEAGTGKDRFARAVHELSERRGRFVTVRCEDVPDDAAHGELFGHASGAGRARGLLLGADGGTLYLDGVDQASEAMRSALLIWLRTGQVRPVGAEASRPADARIVASSRVEPAALRDAGIGDELVRRVAVEAIAVAPLRQRVEDIAPLAAHFVRRHAGEDAPLHHDLVRLLLAHPWPENIAGLERFIEQAVVEGHTRGKIRSTPALERLLEAASARRWELLGPGSSPERPGDAPAGRYAYVSSIPPGAFMVARSGTWFKLPDGERVDLGYRPTLARVLRALVEGEGGEGGPLTPARLLRAGWPDELLPGDADLGRVYVALTGLRKLGLGRLITRSRQGYRLERELLVVVR